MQFALPISRLGGFGILDGIILVLLLTFLQCLSLCPPRLIFFSHPDAPIFSRYQECLSFFFSKVLNQVIACLSQ